MEIVTFVQKYVDCIVTSSTDMQSLEQIKEMLHNAQDMIRSAQ